MKSVYAFGLSVCSRSNSHKYSSNVLNLIYVVRIWHSINRIKNGICTTNGLSTDTQKFSDTLQRMGKKCLKHILTYFYCTKYNEINIGHPHIQKDVSYKKLYKSTNFIDSHKSFLIHCILRGEISKAYFNIFLFH